ncbi:MAG TPA: M20 family metallopeptidase [Acidimicrobiales bacterium]|nr:M20 family metallopeptidase [Acidimicrobiales bacterium]
MRNPDPKAATRENVGRLTPDLLALSGRIHDHPELAFEEVDSSRWVASALADAGFEVDEGVAGLPTAFVATAGSGPLTVGICAEYDALPGIGHACGHNVIAAAAVGAGAALRPLADDLGLTVKVFGTPAEEGGGGKILMLDAGVFTGVDAAMMIHPAPVDVVQMDCLAVAHVDVHYRGRAAHASMAPEEGINAADALTVAQVAIGLLRQHFRGRDQVHGIVTRGGDAPNIVPEATSAKYYLRSSTLAGLEVLRPRVERCFEAGAVATGCTMEVVEQSPAYSEFRPDARLMEMFRRNAEGLGRRFRPVGEPGTLPGGSTDMANVSLAVPAIHPMLGLDCLPAVNHQAAFAEASASPAADRAVVDGAVAMAWTCVDLALAAQP